MPVNQRAGFLPIVGIVILLLIVAGSAYYLGTQQNKVVPSPQPSISIPETQNTLPQSTASDGQEGQWQKYASKKLPGNSLSAYTIEHPSSWVKKVTREDETFDIFTLSKNDYSLEIWQGPTGGGGCIFEGDMPDGPYDDYRNIPYTEIEAGVGTLRRVPLKSDNPEQAVFGFCINHDREFYGKPTIIGAISYRVPVSYDMSILKEMDEIVATLKEVK